MKIYNTEIREHINILSCIFDKFADTVLRIYGGIHWYRNSRRNYYGKLKY